MTAPVATPSRRRRTALAVASVLVPLALPLTLARLTGWTGHLGLLLTAFAPYALVPYVVALAIGVVVLLRGPRERVVLVGSGAVALLLALHVWWVAPYFVGGAPEPAAGAERVRLLSANVEFGGGDAAQFVEQVRARDVDVLVVTEITPPFVAAADAAGLREVLPHRVGRADEAASGTMVFSSEPVDTLARVDTYFDSLVVRTHGLTLLAAHPAPPPLPSAWRHDRPVLLRAARDHDVDVVVGDLNATPDHPTIRDLVGAGWRDAVELTNGGFEPTWPSDGQLGIPFPAVQIDHVLARDSVAVLDVDRVDVRGTDHLAVVATLAAT